MTEIIDYFNEGVDFEKLYEKDIALKYCVLTVLSKCVGNDNSLTGEKLFPIVRSMWLEKIEDQKRPPGDRRIRETIRQLRKSGAGIMSTGGRKGGYWKENSFEEGIAFVQEEFTAKAKDMLHTGKRVLDAMRRKYGGQTEMWETCMEMGVRYTEAIILLEG